METIFCFAVPKSFGDGCNCFGDVSGGYSAQRDEKQVALKKRYGYRKEARVLGGRVQRETEKDKCRGELSAEGFLLSAL